MNERKLQDGTALDYCSELALLPGSLFEFTSQYLTSGQREPLLALYALKKMVADIPHTNVEDSVKWAKLKWWSEELSADPGAPSRHPVLRALWSSGARATLENTLLQQLVSDAVMQIDAVPVSDVNALFERLSATGSTDVLLELSLDDARIEAGKLNYLAAATELSRVISGFATNPQSAITQLPLSLMAKYEISNHQFDNKLYPVELLPVIEELVACGLNWFAEGRAGLSDTLKSGASRHLQLRLAMENRRLLAMHKNNDSVFESNKRYGPGDAWFAWRLLRKLP